VSFIARSAAPRELVGEASRTLLFDFSLTPYYLAYHIQSCSVKAFKPTTGLSTRASYNQAGRRPFLYSFHLQITRLHTVHTTDASFLFQVILYDVGFFNGPCDTCRTTAYPIHSLSMRQPGAASSCLAPSLTHLLRFTPLTTLALEVQQVFPFCLLQSFRFGSTLLPSPTFPIHLSPSATIQIPISCYHRVQVCLSSPLVSGSVGSPWFFFPSSLVSCRCSCRTSSCAESWNTVERC